MASLSASQADGKDKDTDTGKDKDKGKDKGKGKLELITGPMFAGKSTELQRRMQRHVHAGKRVLLVKYAADTRYTQVCEIVTHDRRAVPAHTAVTRLGDVAVADGTDVVLVDEAQFMPDAAAVCAAWADAGLTVIASALDADFRREPFPVTAALMAHAERVDKLSAVCMRCGADAAFSHRKVACVDVELIGGSESYAALCRGCYVAATSGTRA